MIIPERVSLFAKKVASFLGLAAMLPVLAAASRLKGASPVAPWVVGGHRGRLYEDNSAALHRYVVRETRQPIVWIAGSRAVREQLRRDGYAVLRRHSLSARLAIVRAPVLVYSHGESDLDEHLLHVLKPRGLRVFHNHSMNHLKAGQLHRNDVKSMSGRRLRKFVSELTDFDYLLASSLRERQNFALSFPHKADRIVLGGGAHLDFFFETRSQARDGRFVLYFPTFRDDGMPSSTGLDRVLGQLAADERLLGWLERTDRELVVCSHINLKGRRLAGSCAGRRIRVEPPERLRELLLTCAVLVSDYSGTQVDYLVYDKPVIHFPFDLEEYRALRNFYVSYEEFAYGPIVRSAPELVSLLVSESWRDTAPYAARRQRWRETYFPVESATYARSTFETIRGLLAGRVPPLPAPSPRDLDAPAAAQRAGHLG